jgi:hypothetical protein
MGGLRSRRHGIEQLPSRHGHEFTFGKRPPFLVGERNTGDQQSFLETGAMDTP